MNEVIFLGGVTFEPVEDEFLDGVEELLVYTFRGERAGVCCDADGIIVMIVSYVEGNVEHLISYFSDFPFEQMASDFAEYEGIL